MTRLIIITLAILLSKFTNAQDSIEVTHFNKSLNQFLNVRDFTISDEGTEAFFTIQSPYFEIAQIVVIKKKGSEWSEPELLPFCDKYRYLEAFLTADGNRLFFVSDRPLDNTSDEKKDFDIWYVERENKEGPWSEPVNLGAPVNTQLDEFYPSLALNDNLYLTMVAPDGTGKDDIYVCRWDGEKYSAPALLDSNINSTGYEFNAFISRNEDFLLYTRYNEKNGQGSGDLYISRRDSEGNWGKAKNLGIPINTKYMEYCPYYHESSNTLYFTSKRSRLEPKDFKTVDEFQEYVNKNDNGLSKLYKTNIIFD